MRPNFPTLFALTCCLALAAPSLLAAADPGEDLRSAASEGDREAVQRALAAGAEVDAASSGGGTALMYAAYGDHAELVTYLIEAGAEVDRGDRYGDPATHWASYGGAAAAVGALLEGGADPTVTTHHGDALAIAMRRGFPEIVEILVRHTGTDTGDHALHRAARSGDLEAIDRLLAEGAEADVENRIDYTPLMEAAREGHAEAATRLLAAGADPKHRGNELGMGMTALHLAADRNQADIARRLLDRGVPVDAGNAQGTTPLLWALGEGALDTANALLDAGADPTVEDENGSAALGMVEYLEDEAMKERLVAAAEARSEPGR